MQREDKEIPFDAALAILNDPSARVWDYRYAFGIEEMEGNKIGLAGWLVVETAKPGAPELENSGLEIYDYKDKYVEAQRAHFQYQGT